MSRTRGDKRSSRPGQQSCPCPGLGAVWSWDCSAGCCCGCDDNLELITMRLFVVQCCAALRPALETIPRIPAGRPCGHRAPASSVWSGDSSEGKYRKSYQVTHPTFQKTQYTIFSFPWKLFLFLIPTYTDFFSQGWKKNSQLFSSFFFFCMPYSIDSNSGCHYQSHPSKWF